MKNLYVVEGNMDISRLKSLGFEYVYPTNGYALKKESILFLKEVEKVRKIVLLLDPDRNGRDIRRRLEEQLTNYVSVSVPYKLAIGKRKLGVAETKAIDLLDLLKDYLEEDTKDNEEKSIDMNDLLELGLRGDNSFEKRMILNEELHVRGGNCKSLLNDLNLLHKTKDEVRRILDERNK